MIDIIHRNMTGVNAHYANCTWCKHRLSYPKGIDGKYELEMCALTRRKIPGPKEAGRLCDHFQKHGCPCTKCNINITDVSHA